MPVIASRKGDEHVVIYTDNMLRNRVPWSPSTLNRHTRRLVVTVLRSAHSSTIMQTAHILCLTTLEEIQVGQSVVSYLEKVLLRAGDASLFTEKNM